MERYDFIVVGAGTAGCVLAARLSAHRDIRVLLLEAGDADPFEPMAGPAAWPTLMGSTADWADQTVPQQMTGRPVPWPRGRGLGGSSAINAMNFIRGHRASYDAWAEAGAYGWGFNDLLPFFKRSENAAGRDPALRGTDGPLRPGPAADGHPLARAGLEAALQAGYKLASDISGGLECGFGWCDLNIVGGRRQSAADAYLLPVLSRSNLNVVTGALAHRVRLRAGRCTGVDYSVGGKLVSAGAAETVLAAGAVGTPQLLMLSGIGPAGHLRKAGVAAAADLPGVGENLHDHPMTGVVYESARPVPPGHNNHGEALGLISTGTGGHGPDVQVMFVDVPLREGGLPGPGAGAGYTVSVALVTPYSRGRIHLASAEPGASPLIDPRYYTDRRDLDIMTAGLRVAREIGEAPALSPWRRAEALPGSGTRSPQALRRYLRANLRSYSHYAGTAAIGTGPMAVVDAALRVHGIGRLRVADASVMPSPVSANTNATVFAIAERAADLLCA